MQPKRKKKDNRIELFRERLENILDRRHELFRLAGLIDWEFFEKEFTGFYKGNCGQPGTPIRLMVGLSYLQHAFVLSDESVVNGWVENSYWQCFCGETYFQHQFPIDPSSMTKWRKRIGEKGCELILAESIQVGLRGKAVKRSSFKRVTVDTTVQPKAIRYPTDNRSYNRSRERLVAMAKKCGIKLRQTYVRLGPRALRKAGAYSHARQFKRARKQTRILKTYLGRVYRNVLRKILSDPELHDVFSDELLLTKQLLKQTRKSKDKLYSLHAPEVECIAKGKVHKKYEFGVKVSVTNTNRDNFVIGMQVLPGNPFDGHTLQDALDQTRRLTGEPVKRCYVDRGYRGHGVTKTKVFISGQKRRVTPTIKKELKPRSTVEPVIGHMKSDGKLDRNLLQGVLGDKINALLCGAGHNIRIILRKLKERILFFWLFVIHRVFGSHNMQNCAVEIS